MLHVQVRRGTIALVGDWIEIESERVPSMPPDMAIQKQIKRDGIKGHHITVVDPTEMKLIEHKFGSISFGESCSAELLGTCVVHDQKSGNIAWYALVHCSWADEFRARMGLSPRDYHITLGFLDKDIHPIALFEAITAWKPIEEMKSVCERLCAEPIRQSSSAKILKVLQHVLLELSFIHSETDCTKLLRIMGNYCLQALPTTLTAGVLLLDVGHSLLQKGFILGLKFILAATPHIDDVRHLKGDLPASLVEFNAKQFAILRDCNIILHTRALKNKTLMNKDEQTCIAVDSREQQHVLNACDLPRNFSWVSLEGVLFPVQSNPRFLLCGSAIPTAYFHLNALFAMGVRHVITVHENPLSWHSFDSTGCELPDFKLHHWMVPDRTPPTSAQLLEMCACMFAAAKRGEGVLVHCQGGVGRTNTVIAAFLMYASGASHDGAINPELPMSASEAVEQVTQQRPRIILSESQKESLRKWWRLCCEEQPWRQVEVCVSTNVAKPEHTVSAVDNYGRLASNLKLPPLILLCGFAASGKSTFAKTLVEAAGSYFTRINKDEMRGKGQCENVMFDALRAMKAGQAGSVVIDCCNLTQEKRKEWVDMAHKQRAWCIFFDTPLAECKKRISVRSGHPTIHSGASGVRILDSMAKMMQPPTLAGAKKEGFEKLVILKTIEETQELLKSWKIIESVSAPPVMMSELPGETEASNPQAPSGVVDELLKFPRTAHIFNLGAATRDDKVLPLQDVNTALINQHIIVEEKVDGANMGISISAESQQIMVQNRSHFISSKYHPQFAPLDHWLNQHSAELWEMLTPGRHILYGEWVYATHSVKYNRLPGWFVAYDLFDRVSGTFASRAQLSRMLSATTIPHVPLVFEGKVHSVEELQALVKGPSQYSDLMPREGVVVRVLSADGRSLAMRSKLVRHDFIAGNERWNRTSKLETNQVVV